MTIFGYKVGPRIPNIGHFELYEGIWGYVGLLESIWEYINVFSYLPCRLRARTGLMSWRKWWKWWKWSHAPPPSSLRASNSPQTHLKRTHANASTAPQTHLKRTSNAPQTHFKRSSNAPQTLLKRTSNAQKGEKKQCRKSRFIYAYIPSYTFIYLHIPLYTSK